MSHVFISYSRIDEIRLHHASQLEKALRAAGLSTWRDTRGIGPDRDFGVEIEKAIDKAQAVIVCVTKDTLREDSFVRREIQWTLLKDKERYEQHRTHLPLLVVRIEDYIPPIVIANKTFFECWKDRTGEMARLIEYLQALPAQDAEPALPQLTFDPLRPYVESLYERAKDFLEARIERLIELETEERPEAVQSDGKRRQPDQMDLLFEAHDFKNKSTPPAAVQSFRQAFEQLNKRVLLLGEPGAGKTITLMALLRDAAAAWLSDPHTAPVPMLGMIATWKASERQPIDDWLAPAAYRERLRDALHKERALLLLDGLDEAPRQELEIMNNEGKVQEHFDPRQRFVEVFSASSHISANQVVITCRVKEYRDIGMQLPLAGAVQLKPLTESQVAEYLSESVDLRGQVLGDPDLKQASRQPLLLGLIASAFKSRPDALRAAKNLREGDLRDYIFEQYINERYAREARHRARSGEPLPFTLDELYSDLGWLAGNNARGGRDVTENLLTRRDFWRVKGIKNVKMFIDFTTTLGLLTTGESGKWRFIHLWLRDFLAYRLAAPLLSDWQKAILEWSIEVIGGTCDRRAVSQLILLLEDDDWNVHYRAAEALGKIGDPQAVPRLLPLLKDRRWDVYQRTIVALGHIGVVALPHLLPMLTERNNDVRQHVTEALGEIGDPQAVPHLLPLLKDRSKQVRSSAAKALGKLGNPLAVPYLLPLLKDRDDFVRANTAEALGKLGNPLAVPYLLRLLKDKGYYVCEESAIALKRLGTDAVLHLLPLLKNRNWDIRLHARIALGKMEADAVPHLLLLLKNMNEEVGEHSAVRMYAAEALGDIRYLQAVPHLLPLLRDKNWYVRKSAINSLGKIGDPQVVPFLLPLLNTDNNVTAIEALGNIGDLQAVPHLLPLLKHKNYNIRHDAAQALGRIGDPRAVPHLLPLLKDNEWYVRYGAAGALGRIGDPRAVPYLLSRLKDRKDIVRHEVTEGLWSIGSESALRALS
jgi:HEAT repeat protein/DNA replication protein DnaC